MDVTPIIKDPARLEVLKKLLLLDSPSEAAFDRLTQLASKIIGAPVSLVTLIDADRQFYKSAVGIPEGMRETPLSYSLCQYVVATGAPLIVEDTRENEMLKDNLAVTELNVIGYLGMPLTTSDGVGLGSFCVLDTKPRVWTDHGIEIVRELALAVMTEIELRAQIAARTQAEASLDAYNRQLRRVTEFCTIILDQMADALQRGTNTDELAVYVKQARTELKHLNEKEVNAN